MQDPGVMSKNSACHWDTHINLLPLDCAARRSEMPLTPHCMSAAHGEQLRLTVRARFTDDDFAILTSARPHAFIPPYDEPPKILEEEVECEDLVLTGYRIGTEEHAPHFSRRLGFTRASSIVFSSHRRHLFYQCPTYAGDSGAALLLKDGRLIGIHQATVNALKERLDQAKTINGCVTASEESIDQIISGSLAQGGCALLSHVFINA